MTNTFHKENQGRYNGYDILIPVTWLVITVIIFLQELLCLLKYMLELYMNCSVYIIFIVCSLFIKEVLKCLGKINNNFQV